MPSSTLHVAYVNGTIQITEPNGGSVDVTIYSGETHELTLLPSTGVRAVTGIMILDPTPLPEGISITTEVKGVGLLVTDVNSLTSSDIEVEVDYCILFLDSAGNAVTNDPKLINKPGMRGR